MSQPKNDEHWLARPSSIRLIWIAFVAVLAIFVIGDFFIDHHGAFGMDGTVGFYAWYAFVTCVVLVVAARGLGVLLRRKDTYYDG
ncbi:hypothetical protein [Bauldia litoralis]|uniref:Uncharacterized protein n=1 Tax=Bauldia litoralis TaxID=665467 RepID=A0A1G6CDZ6_9HYPH|nr:hypothetical protein [Bauldia litoralis]SDB31124.1 hypothetical protein SAMN02982931_02369 [Bauldia litoralis]